jgi:hypothetical protein
MKNFSKYLNNAIKHQNTNEACFNDNWNIEKLGTTLAVLNLVKKAKWEKFGFNKGNITKKDFLEWHRYYLLKGME